MRRIATVKLFQIEEPDGSPSDPDAPGVAIGIDASGGLIEVALAVGGNAVMLRDREGFERDIPVPETPDGDWAEVFEGARLRAERALARPVTHAVIAVRAGATDGAMLNEAAASAGLVLLRVVDVAGLGHSDPPADAAAIFAEDLAPRPEAP